MTDSELMEMIKSGDASAFDHVFEKYSRLVKLRLLQILQDDAVAEDILQEVFLRLWTKADQWRGTGTLAGWLLRMATNLALNQLRTVKRRRSQAFEPESSELDDDDDSAVPAWMIDHASLGPDEQLNLSDRAELLHSLVNSLPEQQREVVQMAHEMGMDIPSIANQLSIPPGTVKSRLFYARNKLQHNWKQMTEGERE